MSNPQGSDLKPAIKFLAWMTVSYLAAFAVFEGTSQGVWFWYVSINRPAWAPPTWLFTPMSTILYGLMGLAVWKVSKEPDSGSKTAGLTFFFLQLAFGALWPWIYFAWHKLPFSCAIGALTLVTMIVTVTMFWKTVGAAGKLMLPVVAWCLYMNLVDIALWRLNR